MSMITNPVGYEDFGSFIQYLLNYAVGTSILLAVIALIISGFKYMLAMGDEEKVKSATQSLLFSLVGLALVFIAPLLVNFIINQLGA